MSDNRITATLLPKMETPMAYSIRRGTNDSGRAYEIKMAALLLLRCINHAQTKHTWLAMNMDRCGAFDDVVLYRQTKEGKKAIYLVQLKHEDKGSNIKSEEFKTKKDKQDNPFLLAKYFESISEISQAGENSESHSKEEEEMIDYLWRHHNDIIFVLFTNRGTTTGCDFLRYVKKASAGDTKWLLYESLNTTSNGTVYEIDFQKLDNKSYQIDPEHLKKFFLFTKQEHITKMDAALTKYLENFIRPTKVSQKQLSDMLLKFELYIREWSKGNLGGHYPMNKSNLLKKLTEFLLDPYMTILDGHLTNQNLHQKLWNLIIEDKDVIVINEADVLVSQFVKDAIYSVLKECCHNLETINWWKSNAELIKKEVATLKATTDTVCYMEAYCYLWKTRQIPLVVEVKDSYSAKQLQDILRFSQGIFRVIVLNKTGSFVEKVTGLKVFSNIGALDQDHKKTLLQQPVTLQGRKPSIPLANCVGTNFKHVSVKDIIYILLGKFNVGNELQSYPRFYEEMTLTRVWLKISVLLEVPDDFFLMQCVDSNACRDYLQNYRSDFCRLKICTWQDIKTNSAAQIILFEENHHFKIIESYYLKKGKSFHVLVFHNNDHLEWIKSKGSVTNIRPYSKIVNGEFNSITSKNFTTNMISNRKSVVISSHSGMGKSVLLSHIAQYIPSDWWIVAINLAEHSDDYKIWERQTPSAELFRTLMDKILNNQKCHSQLSKTTFRKYCDNKQVVFFLDGFDEVQVYYHVGVKKLIKHICDAGFIMCITTRPVQQMELETLLNTFSITLNPFTKNNQTNFLKNIFSEAAGVSAFDKRMESFVDSLLVATKANLNDHDNDFAGVPLQTILLADVFTEDCIRYMKNHKFDNNHFDLHYLYKTFIKKKINIAFNKIECISEDMIDNYKVCRSFYALKLLFSENALESLHIDKKLEGATKLFPTMLQLLQKDGIMAVSSENYVSFIHRSFAEYIAAEWLSENINGKYKEVAKNLLKECFQPNFDVVRNIFDRILAKDCPLHLAIISRQVDEVQNLISSNVDIFHKTDKGNRIFLHLIASWGFHHPLTSYASYTTTERFRLRKLVAKDTMIKIVNLIPNDELKKSSKDDILDYTPLDYAFASGSFNIANILSLKHSYYFPLLIMVDDSAMHDFIKEMVYLALTTGYSRYRFENVNVRFKKFCDARPEDSNLSAIHLAAKSGDIETILSNFADEEVMNEVDPWTLQTPLHIAVMSGHTEIVLLLLSNRTKPNTQDFIGRTPLHWALCRQIEDITVGERTTSLTDNPTFSLSTRNKSVALSSPWNDLLAIISSLIVVPDVSVNIKDKYSNTPLMLAAHKGYTNIVKLLLSKGADIEATGSEGDTALHIAAEYGHADVIDVLLSQNVNIEAKDTDGSTALLVASYYGYRSVVDLLLSHGAHIEAVNDFGNTALALAALYGYIDVVNTLMSHGANTETKNSKGNNALILSAHHGHTDIVNLLLSHGANKNARNNNGDTALMVAADRPDQNCHVLNLLMSYEVDTETTDNGGNTPLMIATLNGHIDTVRRLLSRNLEKNVKNKEGATALSFAADAGQTEIVKLLLQEGLDIDAKNGLGYTPLISATCNGHVDTVAYLLAEGSDKEATTNEGHTALIAAALNGHAEVLNLLISDGANKEATNNNFGNTALLEAAYKGHADIVSALLSAGADKYFKNAKGVSVLMAAAVGGHALVVDMLLFQGADKNAINNHGDTALIFAASRGHSDVVNVLLAAGSNTEIKNILGSTALILAASNGHSESVNLLLSQGVDIDARDNEDRTALALSSCHGYLEVVKLLLVSGSDKNARDKNGDTALILAARNGHTSVIDLILSESADPSLRDENNDTALTIAARYGHIDAVNLLLSRGLDKEATNNFGDTALTIATCNVHIEILKLLLLQGADVEARPHDGNTALMCAVYKGHVELVNLLLSHGADPDTNQSLQSEASLKECEGMVDLIVAHGVKKSAIDSSSYTALLAAVVNEHVDVVDLLLSYGANPDTRTLGGNTVLMVAIGKGSFEIMRLLVAKKANIEATNDAGCNALIVAARNGRTEMVSLLLTRPLHIESKNKSGQTALIGAAIGGHTGVVRLLLSHGSDKEAKTHNDDTALILGAYFGHTDVVRFLLSQGSNIEAKAKQGNTALLSAVNNGHLETVKLLLSQGANKQATTNNGATAFILAALQGHTRVVEFLLSQGFDKDDTVANGNSALIAAACNGHTSTVSFLLSLGVNLEIKTSKGNTALTAAAIDGHLDVTILLLTHGSNKEATDKDGNTALILAASNGHDKVVELLLAKGSERSAVNNNGENALTCAKNNGHHHIVWVLRQE